MLFTQHKLQSVLSFILVVAFSISASTLSAKEPLANTVNEKDDAEKKDDPNITNKNDLVILFEDDIYSDIDPISEILHQQLTEIATNSPKYDQVRSNHISIDDLLLPLDCFDSDPQCLAQLKPVLESEAFIYVKWRRKQYDIIARVVLFSFTENKVIAEKEALFPANDPDSYSKRCQALAENLFLEPRGNLTISPPYSRDDGTLIYLDGQIVTGLGKARSFTRLPFGFHTITVEYPDGTTESENVFLKPGEHVHFKPKLYRYVSTTRTFYDTQIPGWILFSAGIAGITTGIVGNALEADANEKIVSLCKAQSRRKTTPSNSSMRPNPCTNPSTKHAYLYSYSDADKLAETTKRGAQGKTLQLIGYTTGVTSLIAGGILLYLSYVGLDNDSNPVGNDESDTNVSFSLFPTQEGAFATSSITF